MKILIDGNGTEIAALLCVLLCNDADDPDDAEGTDKTENRLQIVQGLLKDLVGMQTNQTKTADESKIGLPTETVQQIVDEIKAVEAKQTTQTSAPSATNQRKFSKAEAKEILDKIFHDAPPDFIGSLIKTASDTDTEEIIKAFKAMTLTRIKKLERGEGRNISDETRSLRECVEAILHWKL